MSTVNRSTNLTDSFSSRTVKNKTKISRKSLSTDQQKSTTSISNRKNSKRIQIQTNNITSDINNTADIRSRVPKVLYNKVTMRYAIFFILD